MIGTVIDKYEILQKIGEGGMATVYRARHLTLQREVALKILHPHLSSTARNRRRFEQEARAIERLEHTNILTKKHSFIWMMPGRNFILVPKHSKPWRASQIIDRCEAFLQW